MSKNGDFHITVHFVNLNNHYLFNSCQHIYKYTIVKEIQQKTQNWLNLIIGTWQSMIPFSFLSFKEENDNYYLLITNTQIKQLSINNRKGQNTVIQLNKKLHKHCLI